jgi:hypothetical protein
LSRPEAVVAADKRKGGLMFKKLKKKIDNYLKRLAEINEESFGKQKLDCCDLNKNNKSKAAR